jgi:signal transduction histidine kinase
MVSLDINDVIRESILLVQREVLSHGVSLRTELASALPPVLGDRVQLQQVLINLLINGVEAMAPITDRPREILIRSRQDEAGQVHVISRSIIKAHGGRLWVAPNPDHGAAFQFTVPTNGQGAP